MKPGSKNPDPNGNTSTARLRALGRHLSAALPPTALPNIRPAKAPQPDSAAGSSVYVRGNFAPTQTEGHWGDIEVLEGSVPSGLCGAFMRIGPNPRFDFDGLQRVLQL